MHPLVKGMKNKDIRALARAITRVENLDPDKQEILKDLSDMTGTAHRIGITGSPGAGKSSLVNRLIAHLREEGLTVAVIAVDPTSPFSGGAILGDRVRMPRHFTDEGVFIRSMATRGNLGGLARATKDALHICDAYGFDVILVETVGVGQSELDIMKLVDTTALVLAPNSGDLMQVFKAGIMEIADLFVVNKSDLPGVGKLRGLLKELVEVTATEDYKIPILKVMARENKGISQLWEAMKAHHQYLHTTRAGQARLRQEWESEVMQLVYEKAWQELDQFIQKHPSLLARGEGQDPYRAAREIYEQWKEEE